MQKPLPRITSVDRPFWNACNEERVLIQRCTADGCGQHVYYPRVCCPHCHRDTLEWTEVSGMGSIVSHTMVHRTHHDSFNEHTPYVFAAVRLDEGPIVYARIEGGENREDLTGRKVTAVFEQLSITQKVLSFKL